MKSRTKFDKNEIIMCNNHAEIILYKNNIEIEKAIIDIDDVEKIKNMKWYLTPQKYVRNAYCAVFLHNFILNHKPNKKNIIDHINRNRIDCRKENLRITTYEENGINKGKQSNNTTGYVGISFDKNRNKYSTHIKIHGKKLFLGRFYLVEDALLARKEAEIKYFGHEVNRENDKHTIFKQKGEADAN